MIASDIFNEFFIKEYEQNDGNSYRGNQTLVEVEPNLRRILLEVQERLNSSFETQNDKIVVDGQNPRLYYSYVDAVSENKHAFAFHYKGFYFVGLTMPLIYLMVNAAKLLAESERLHSLFQMPVGDALVRTVLFTVILGGQLNFLFSHELGHHMWGHTFDCEPQVHVWKEFDPVGDARLLIGEQLNSQAEEFQADAHAVHLVLSNLLDGNIREASLAMLGRKAEDKQADELLLGLFTITFASIMFVMPSTNFQIDRVYGRTHPPKAGRVNNVMSNVVEWCRINKPHVADWMNLDKFQRFVEVVQSALEPMLSDYRWEEEIDYMRSPEGERYLKRLSDRIRKIQAQPKAGRWEISHS